MKLRELEHIETNLYTDKISRCEAILALRGGGLRIYLAYLGSSGQDRVPTGI